MQLFYTPGITLPLYTLPAEESVHAVRALRLREGDELHLTDGRGSIYRARVVEADAKGCRVEVVESRFRQGEMPYSLTVGIAPTKNIDRFEWFLEKATEVGVGRIVPLECERSERRVVKRERAVRVVTEAVKQSVKCYHPQLDELTPFERLVGEPFDGLKLIAHCDAVQGSRAWIGDALREADPDHPSVMILIGPEGDFSPREIDRAVGAGFREITLGEERLRTETAGLAAVMALHFFTRK